MTGTPPITASILQAVLQHLDDMPAKQRITFIPGDTANHRYEYVTILTATFTTSGFKEPKQQCPPQSHYLIIRPCFVHPYETLEFVQQYAGTKHHIASVDIANPAMFDLITKFIILYRKAKDQVINAHYATIGEYFDALANCRETVAALFTKEHVNS